MKRSTLQYLSFGFFIAFVVLLFISFLLEKPLSMAVCGVGVLCCLASFLVRRKY